MVRRFFILALLLMFSPTLPAQEKQLAGVRWSGEKAAAWHKRQPWLVGCNFIPSSAINQLEMWQADTYDPKTIDRELGGRRTSGLRVCGSSCTISPGSRTPRDSPSVSIIFWPAPTGITSA